MLEESSLIVLSFLGVGLRSLSFEGLVSSSAAAAAAAVVGPRILQKATALILNESNPFIGFWSCSVAGESGCWFGCIINAWASWRFDASLKVSHWWQTFCGCLPGIMPSSCHKLEVDTDTVLWVIAIGLLPL